MIDATQEHFLAMGDSDSVDFKDIVEYCTNWPVDAKSFDAVLHHRDVEENLAIQTPEGVTNMQIWQYGAQ